MAIQNTSPTVGQSRLTTTNEEQVVSSFLTVPGHGYQVTAAIAAVRTDADGEGAGYLLAAAFRTDADGTLSQIGTTVVVAASEDTAGWDADLDSTVDADSNPIIVANVTGENNKTIAWRCELTIVPVGAGFNQT